MTDFLCLPDIAIELVFCLLKNVDRVDQQHFKATCRATMCDISLHLHTIHVHETPYSQGSSQALIPWADFINHAVSSSAHFDWDAAYKSVVLVADRDYQPGEQVCECTDSKSRNDENGRDHPLSDLSVDWSVAQLSRTVLSPVGRLDWAPV